MDLIEDFAFRLPVTIICDMLGIPEDHREVFYRSSRDGGRLLDPVPLTPAEIEQANAGNLAAQMYFQQLFELRRRSPGDDLTTQLVQAEEDGSKLSNEELTANIILLFGAGHETTVNLIGNGLLALHRNPDQLALLKAHPELITNAIEEFLRYDSSVQMSGRVALEDIDDLGGKQIPKGEGVLCLLGSANRDPAVYPDRPDRLDITRPNVRPPPLAAASISASAPNWHASRRRSPSRPCCGVCRNCGWTMPKIRNGDRPSCCAVSRRCRQVGEENPNKPALAVTSP